MDSVILDLRQRLETERRNLCRLEQHLLQANIDAGRAEDDAREVIRAPNGEIAYVSASSRTRLEEAISSLTSRYIGVREALRHAPQGQAPVVLRPNGSPVPKTRNISEKNPPPRNIGHRA